VRRSAAGVILGALAILAPALAAAAVAPSSAAFDATCAICHGLGAVGAPGQFPRLAGRANLLARTPDGRRLLIDAALWGVSGRIQADGAPIVGVMPGFASLDDGAIARILTYVSGLGGGGARGFTAAEVAAARGTPMTPAQVNALAREPDILAIAP
jgi:mono/diheme cytochrome c family protein